MRAGGGDSGVGSDSGVSMGPLEIRKVDFRAGEDGDGPKGIGLEVRGLIPVNRPLNLGLFTTSRCSKSSRSFISPVILQ